MATWCAEHLRDVKAWQSEGLALSVSSDEAAKLFDSAVRQLVSLTDCDQFGGIHGTAKRMIKAEPEFLMGRVFSLGLDALGVGRSVRTDLNYKAELDALLADSANFGTIREQRHANAVHLFANGEMQSACIEWEKVLAEHPNDLLALRFSHDAYFFVGDCYGKRDSVGRVIEKWDKNAPCYSYLHGMYAFGLEECEQYAEAERQARVALQLQRKDCWATHALAHCYEMRSNFSDGLTFMESTENDWAPGNLFACHNYWHVALFYIEKGDFESALTVYDNEVLDRALSGGAWLSLTDAASLLARLELEGVEVGNERWHALIGLTGRHIADQLLAFSDAHIALVLNRPEKNEKLSKLATEHAENVAQFASFGTGDNARITRLLGKSLCDGIVAFQMGQFERTFDLVYPIRTQLYKISGSNAQRDIFTQMLLHTALRCSDNERRSKATVLIEERNKMKPNSAVIERLLQKHKQTAHNNC
ncbi:hypothetical protein niasHS_005751 [Heterodera schachtii]|uniref:Tetratricopeptide repeat protein 38 n=2 Tax=Heterodera TaxID=34509 RepID=A0ABD2JZD1_HETSC